MQVRSLHAPALNGRLLRLEMGEVHVWELPLDVPRTVLDRLERLISAEEAARAARFAFAGDRDRYRAAHGLLRLALAGYLGTSPKEIEFARSAGGSPGMLFEPSSRRPPTLGPWRSTDGA